MPTGFDDFSPAAFANCSTVSPKAIANRAVLMQAMGQGGFEPLATEWWHFEDPQEERDLLDVSFDELCTGAHRAP
jgi:D-alanyl-D-alanine dipeptidase